MSRARRPPTGPIRARAQPERAGRAGGDPRAQVREPRAPNDDRKLNDGADGLASGSGWKFRSGWIWGSLGGFGHIGVTGPAKLSLLQRRL